MRPWRCWVGFALWALACLTAWAQAPAATAVPDNTTKASCGVAQELNQARRIAQRDGRLLADEIVALPDMLPTAWRNESVKLIYEFDVSTCAHAVSASLWLYRVGAPYRVNAGARVLPPLLGKRPIAADEAVRISNNGRIPALFALPSGARSVQVELLTLPYIPSGMTLVRLGPTNLMAPVAVQSVESVVGQADAAAGVMLVLALMACVLWAQRPHDLGFLWMSLACLSWSMRALAYFGGTVRMPALWFEQLNPLNILLTAAAMCAATLSTIVVRPQAPLPPESDWRRLPRRVMLFMVVTGCLAFLVTIALDKGALLARAWAQACALALALWTVWWLWTGQLRMGRWHRAGTIVGYLVLIGSAMHDMWLVTGGVSVTGPSYLFWGFAFLLVVYAVISGDYIIATLNRAEHANQELERRVAEKSDALEHSYAQLRRSEIAAVRLSARQQERERLLRDMHDGLGAQLMTALRGVERSALNREQIAHSLLDGLDELRMLMDSADMGRDLTGVLAAWRNRWDPRLGAAGVQLHWHMGDSLEDVAVSSDVLLQLMRVLQEAATNVVKHAQAANLHVDASAEHNGRGAPRLLRLTLVDDGRGLPAEDTRAGQRGLRNMRHRADMIGARLRIENVTGAQTGCRITLEVPVEPAEAPASVPAGLSNIRLS